MLIGPEFPAEYLTLDDEAVRSAAVDDPTGFVAGLGRRTIIDEIQRAPKLLLAIKIRLDRDNARGQFLLTGSANLRRLPTVADALPGRLDYLTLWPLTQGELAGRHENLLERLFAGDVPRVSSAPVGREAYTPRLLAGGFPEAQQRTEAARVRFFDGYVASIVDRDIDDAGRVHDPDSVGTLLRLVAARSGGLARYDSLGRDAGVDGKTAKSHLAVLERLFLVRIRRPWHVNLGQRQVKAPKLYISDPGLLCALVGADEGRFAQDGGLAGSVIETFVATELERQAAWSPRPLTFWHFREGEREVDTIVEHPSGEIVGVEVKAGATVRASDFAGLRHLRDKMGDRFKCGIVVHPGERTLPFGDRLWAVPLEALWSSPGR